MLPEIVNFTVGRAAETTRCALTVELRDPDTPFTGRTYEPSGVVDDVWTVSNVLVPAVILAEKLAVVPFGSPVTENVTAPVNDLREMTILNEPFSPRGTVTLSSGMLRLNVDDVDAVTTSGAAVTCLSEPLVPVM